MPSFVFRPLARSLAPSDAAMVLTYHRVAAQHDELLPDVPDMAIFERQVQAVLDVAQPLTLAEAYSHLEAGTTPRGAVVFTFDDGYANNHDCALPVLQKLGAKATFFVSTGFLNGSNMWNDEVIEAIRATAAEDVDLSWLGIGRVGLTGLPARRQAVNTVIDAVKYLAPDDRAGAVARLREQLEVAAAPPLMMTPAQVAALSDAGMEIGGHTVSHPILTSLPEADCEAEIAGNKQELERICGHTLTSFAYPNGRFEQDFDQRHERIAADAGYRIAATTEWGLARPSANPYQLPRMTLYGEEPARLQARLLRNWWSDR